MNRSGWRSHLTALLTATLVCVGLLSLSSAPAWAAAGTITEFSTPTGSGGPIGITTRPDGNRGFTAGPDMGPIPAAGSFTTFSIPTASSGPQGITAGPDGNLWFTERAGNQIGRITTVGLVTEFHIGSVSSGPFGITAGPDGNL